MLFKHGDKWQEQGKIVPGGKKLWSILNTEEVPAPAISINQLNLRKKRNGCPSATAAIDLVWFLFFSFLYAWLSKMHIKRLHLYTNLFIKNADHIYLYNSQIPNEQILKKWSYHVKRKVGFSIKLTKQPSRTYARSTQTTSIQIILQDMNNMEKKYENR
jgi:hypothetical protein